MLTRSPLGLSTRIKLAAATLLIWGVALLLFVDIDRLAGHW